MKIYLLGAANPETIRMVRACERSVPGFHFAGFLDNDSQKHGRDFHGYPVHGGLELVGRVRGDDVGFVNLITGSTLARHTTTSQILAAGGRLANFIHPTVDLTMTHPGVGLYLQEGVIVQAEVTIEDNVSIHMGALIGHESRIGRSAFVAHAVSVSGSCNIGEGAFVGTNATILPRLSIGRWATVGAGSVITRDVPDFAVVAGNPAKVIRFIEPPAGVGAA